jgi:hypothetical protein
LASYWAKREANTTVLLQLEKLILDWPFDFIWIKGDSPEEQEENMVKYTANMAARIERLREFVGLESQSVMRIVAEAQKIVAAKSVGKKKPSKEAVHTWLDENVKWGVRKCPSVRTVGEILANWETLQASPLVRIRPDALGPRQPLRPAIEDCSYHHADGQTLTRLCRGMHLLSDVPFG